MNEYQRPDEKAAQSEIERAKKLNKVGKTVAGAAIGLGTAAIGGPGIASMASGLSSRLLPLLNKYITPDLAVKGISKVSPKLGEFLKKGMASGLPIKEGLDFLKGEMTKGQPQEQKAPDQRNIIEQYSPELHQFLKDEITKGRPPIEAGALAQSQDKFKNIIKKLSQDHKTDFSSILQSIYGSGQQGSSQPQQPQQQSQQSQQPGQGQQALMSILQKIQQARGGQS